ncbi:hypothetical protein F2P81_016968 [Scophthalmus maximus]|uniref:Uncharacterized protein n=1 Tax=Scophthalmus maximus TaxID=52904 RepID=A0A6A4SAL2_SCOMX|nr:hypothetical protein F2P81_016968 [Scophthalmus maximus]
MLNSQNEIHSARLAVRVNTRLNPWISQRPRSRPAHKQWRLHALANVTFLPPFRWFPTPLPAPIDLATSRTEDRGFIVTRTRPLLSERTRYAATVTNGSAPVPLVTRWLGTSNENRLRDLTPSLPHLRTKTLPFDTQISISDGTIRHKRRIRLKYCSLIKRHQFIIRRSTDVSVFHPVLFTFLRLGICNDSVCA